MTSTDDVWVALDRATDLPYGPGRSRAVEEVIRLADARGTTEQRVAARIEASSAYQTGGEPDRFHVTFAWCVAALDRGEVPDELVHDVLWQFKWAAGAYRSFPQLSLEQARTLIGDMERRYAAGGHRLGPVHQSRANLAAHVGDRATAEAELRRFRATPRGSLSDCAGCEPSDVVGLLTWLDRPDEAVAAAAGVLDGTLECEEQPHDILTSLLVPYLLTGAHDAAVSAHRRAYRSMQGQARHLEQIADHVDFCVRTGDDARGLEIVQRHLPLLPRAPSPAAERDLAAAASAVLTRVAERRPALTVVHDGHDVPAAVLARELATRARGIAAAFDARNGTGEQGARVERLLAPAVVAELPLSAPAPPPGRRRLGGVLRRDRRAAPSEPALPADPAELADRAVRHRRVEEDRAAAAVWRRFDEVCPDPRGRLLALRLEQRALDSPEDDREAERLGRLAAEAFTTAGDEAQRWDALGRVGERVAWTDPARADEGRDLVRAAMEHATTLGADDVLARVGLRLARLLSADDAQGARDALDTALAAAGRSDDAVTRGATRIDAAEVLLQLTHDEDEPSVDEVDRHLDEALRLLRGAQAPVLVAQAQRLRAITTHVARGPERAAARLAAIDLPDEPLIRAVVRRQQGLVAVELDEHAAAYRHLTEAIEAFGAAGDAEQRALTCTDLLEASYGVDRVADGATAVEDALPVLDAIGDPEDAARARNSLAAAYRELGEPEQAIALYEWVRAHSVATGNGYGVAAMDANIGNTLVEQDRDSAGADRLTAAADGFAAVAAPLDELRVLRQAAVARATAVEHDAAVALVERADRLLAGGLDDDPDLPWERAMLAFDGARVLAEAGRWDDALARVAPAPAAFRALDAPTEAGIAGVLRGRLLADLDRPAEARAALREALSDLPRAARDVRREVKELLAELPG